MAVKRLVRLRGGVERLEVVRGRRFQVRREDRRCLVCEGKEVEDEEHFIDRCAALTTERNEMWGKIGDVLMCPHKLHKHLQNDQST